MLQKKYSLLIFFLFFSGLMHAQYQDSSYILLKNNPAIHHKIPENKAYPKKKNIRNYEYNSIFLKSDYIEIGIHPAASFGSDLWTEIPDNYHPTHTYWSIQYFMDTLVGFNYDIGKDGYENGDPDYMGDYFVPGTPLEGWGVEWTNNTTEHTFINYGAIADYAGNSYFQILPVEFLDKSTPYEKIAYWKGHANNNEERLTIEQTVRLGNNKSHFTIEVVITNTGNVSLDSVEYFRNVDPDQEVRLVDFQYVTRNYVVAQPGEPGNPDTAMVVAKGLTYGAPLILGTIDSRARVTAEKEVNKDGPIVDPDDILDTPNTPEESNPLEGDYQIALAYRLGKLEPGECVSFVYYYNMTELVPGEIVFPLHPDFLFQNQSPYEILFTDNSYGIGAAAIINRWWDFDNDGIFDASGDSVTHRYLCSGNYPVKYKVQLCDGSLDSVSQTIHIQQNDIFNYFPDDTVICQGDTAFFTAHQGFESYTWYNGSNNRDFFTDTAGVFWIDITDEQGCAFRDSVEVYVQDLPQPDLGPDINECVGTPIQLEPGNFEEYIWNTGSLSPQIQVKAPGDYAVLVKDRYGCQGSDTIRVNLYPFNRGQANVWYFGWAAGLDFNTTPPTVLTDGQTNTYEGVATISNPNGELLFYTDGKTVWDSSHTVMPNGTELFGHSSSSQSGVIVPQPASNNLHYLFSVDAYAGDSGVHYSVVDMSLRNDSGDVTVKNVPLFTPSTEKLTAIRHSNNIDVWVIGHEWNSSRFLSYKLTSFGLDTVPVISESGLEHSNNYPDSYTNYIGYMKSSPDGSKLAVAMKDIKTVQVFDFDNSTGKINNPLTLTGFEDLVYGVEFSPDGSKLYVSEFNYRITQFDLTAGNEKDIQNSAFVLRAYSPRQTGALQLAVNGKIYVAIDFFKWVGVIHNPNAAGWDCGFEKTAVKLKDYSRIGLPNFVQSYFNTPGFNYKNACFSEQTQFESYNLSDVDSIYWNFDDNDTFSRDFHPSHTFSDTGIYQVQAIFYQSCVIDTVVREITIYPPMEKPYLGKDTTICYGSPLMLSTPFSATHYLWNDSTHSTSSKITVHEGGTYILQVADINGCSNSDTIEVIEYPLINLDFDVSHVVCYGEKNGEIDLSVNGGTPPYTILWSNDSTTEGISALSPGMYSVTVTDKHCSFTDSAAIMQADTAIELSVSGTDTVCFNQTGNINLSVSGGMPPYSYYWSNDSTSRNLTNVPAGNYSVNLTDSFGCTRQTNFMIAEIPEININLLVDTLDCYNGENSMIQVQVYGGIPPYQYSLDSSTFVTENNFSPSQPGQHIIYVKDDFGCIENDTTTLYFSPEIITLADTTYPATCYGYNDGTLLYHAQGGSGQLRYSIDNENWQENGIFMQLAAGAYYVVVKDSLGCTLKDTVLVSQPDDLVLSLDIQNPSCSQLNDGKITAFAIGGTPPYFYNWSTGVQDSILENVGAGIYTMLVKDSHSCTDTDSAILTAAFCESSIEMPNVFSPNQDGYNDYFHPKAKHIVELECTIYNRWGRKIAIINEVTGKWDGKNMRNNNLAPKGVYYYMLKAKGLDGKHYKLQGFFHLLR